MQREIDVPSACQAGLIGALCISGVTLVARAAGVPMSLETFSGTFLGIRPGILAWSVGFMMHLVIGCAFALAYAWVFDRLEVRQSRPIGAALGLLHGAFAGVLIGLISKLHVGIPEFYDDPGFFMSNTGWFGVVLFFGLHAGFGMIVATAYRLGQADDVGVRPYWQDEHESDPEVARDEHEVA